MRRKYHSQESITAFASIIYRSDKSVINMKYERRYDAADIVRFIHNSKVTILIFVLLRVLV